MKTKMIFILICGLMLTANVSAQNSQPQSLTMAQEIQKGDSVIMKEGNVWLIKEGKRIVVTTEVTIGGTKVQHDGAVIFKDGITATLQEGDVILADGKLVRAIIKVRSNEPMDKRQ